MNTTRSMLEKLKELNPTLDVYHCEDEAFQKYGTVVSNYDFSGMIAKANEFTLPAEGVEYLRSVSELEDATLLSSLSQSFFNNVPLQAGICHGRNNKLNALEWHPSNELLVAASSVALFLGHVDEMMNLQYDVRNIRAFYVPAGSCVLLFHTTLHFAPLHAERAGFRAIIILPKMTNAPFEENPLKVIH
ncbi:MAG: DUF4867 family protein, partial [Spirochaetes bacterium]|nr:DUF4867 family protein [Spirochaetota bacterium]